MPSSLLIHCPDLCSLYPIDQAKGHYSCKDHCTNHVGVLNCWSNDILNKHCDGLTTPASYCQCQNHIIHTCQKDQCYIANKRKENPGIATTTFKIGKPSLLPLSHSYVSSHDTMTMNQQNLAADIFYLFICIFKTVKTASEPHLVPQDIIKTL